MLSRTKQELRAVEDKIAETEAATEVIETAAKDGRSRTDDENAQVAEYHKALEVLKENKREWEDQLAVEEGIKDSVKQMDPPSDGIKNVTNVREPDRSIGEQFVMSDAYKSIQSKGFSGQFTERVELQAKGTLLEGPGAPGTGTGGAFNTVPQVQPGVVETLFQRLTVADLLASGTTNTTTVRYVVEGTATSGADGVAEAAEKPESTLALSTVDEPVKKIATTLTVSDEMLEDAAQVQSYINGRLSLFVKINEEAQLVSGAGTNDLVGLTDTARGINIYAAGTVDNNAVALFKALNGTRGSSFLEPDAIIMNPANWQVTRLLTDTAGQFFGGGPFTSAYAGSQGPTSAAGGQLAQADTLWGKPVVVTTAVGAGTALLGSFSQAAQVFRRSGLTVEASNSHSDYFTKNLVSIRAEERLALAVYRPTAFTQVTGLD